MKISKNKVSSKIIQYIIDSSYRITLYSSSLIRAEYSKKGLFNDENTLITEPTFSEEAAHTIKETKDFFLISTDKFELKLFPNGKQFDIGNLFFTAKDTKVTWQPGISDNDNLGGAMLDLYKFPGGRAEECFTEGLISKNGYFINRDHCEYLWDKEKNWIKKRQDYQFQDWYLFGYGSDYKRAFLDYIRLFGKIPLPPKWVFGYWYSKWHKFKDVEILELIKKIRDLDIPLDVFVVDTDWRKNVWNGYEWNKELFPEPKGFLQELKRQNIHTCLNDHPGYRYSDELPLDDPYREKVKSRIPDLTDYRIKWSDSRYVYAWLKEIFVKFLKDGVDFWWVDGWGAADRIEDVAQQLWVNKFYFEAAKMAGDNRRPMILSRWGGIGAQKYPIQFSGDTLSTYETLKYQISFTHKGGNIGAAYWSHDIGGFAGGKITDELFMRWLQFGCFAPIMRTHSSGGDRQVWNYSEKVLENFKKYIKIRYALFPYFYNLSRECFDTGLPLMRGLYLEYPNDKNSYTNDEEYLIGNSMLVAPAYGPGDNFERQVYFPKGSWISLEGNSIVKGPCYKKIKVPLEQIPVYIKKGSVIPTKPVKENLSEKISEIEFNIFPDSKTEFSYYEDDGLTENYKNNEFITQKIEVFESKKEIKINILPVSGKYKGCPEEINYKINVFLNKRKPKTVLVDYSKKEFKFAKKIFSETINTKHKILNIDLGHCERNEEINIVIKLG